MASNWATADSVISIIGAEALAAVAPDADAADGIDRTKLDAAVASVNSHIDAAAQMRYEIPVADAAIPDYIKRDAAYLAHEMLCESDATITELITSRGNMARKRIEQLQRGQLRLAVVSPADDDDNAGRTTAGRAAVVTDDADDRQFARGDAQSPI